MPQFVLTPIEHDPFDPTPVLDYAREVGGAPRAATAGPAIVRGFSKDVNDLVGGLGAAFGTVGNALMGNTSLEVGPNGAVSPIDPALVDASNVLSGLVMEGGLAAPRPRGSLGVFGGVNAKTANLDALARAMRFEQNGFTPEEVWKTTGWFKGTDGKWKFEIPDTESKFREGKIRPQGGPFEAVDREDHIMDFAQGLGYDGRADLLKNGSAEQKLAAQNYADRMVGKATTLGEILDHPALYEAYPALKNMKVERHPEGLNSGGVYDPINNHIEALAGGSPGTQHNILLHEVQHAIQSREQFAHGGSPNDPAIAEVGNHLKQQLQGQLDSLDAKRNSGQALSEEEWAHKIWLERTMRRIAPSDPGRLGYQTLAGEVESRNVENRHVFPSMLEEPPWETEDIPRVLQWKRLPKDWIRSANE